MKMGKIKKGIVGGIVVGAVCKLLVTSGDWFSAIFVGVAFGIFVICFDSIVENYNMVKREREENNGETK